jgi:SAM-dependent methyltransferase
MNDQEADAVRAARSNSPRRYVGDQRRSAVSVAAEVQDFYEQHPYPRPIEDLEEYRRLWQNRQRQQADFRLFWPTRRYRENFSILVAGCGTSQAAKHALRRPTASVTAIDFSATSVRCTEELKRKYSLSNLEIHQLPIERASELAASFDQIVCTGVLHHLPDPLAGLTALRALLKPGGVMHLMVYAPYGRTGIYMLQEFCRRIGIESNDQGIRDLRVALASLPRAHPLAMLLREAPRFRQEAELADALLHPQDRAYSVTQLFELLKDAGLAFVRWVRQAPYSPHCGAIRGIPQFSKLARLAAAEQYAAVELFRGTMVRHSVIVSQEDSKVALRRVDFSGDAWLRYVPIRLPDTLCVQERLPPAAAAVLINRAHTDTDLFLPIDEQQKRLFDAIDGERTIGQIVRRILPLDSARAFFERLESMDQIVIDATQALSSAAVTTHAPLERIPAG